MIVSIRSDGWEGYGWRAALTFGGLKWGWGCWLLEGRYERDDWIVLDIVCAVKNIAF